ncbi:MAG: hypothetical protein U0R18_08240 [Mycobacterium sp.]
MSGQYEAVDLDLAHPYAADEFAGAVLAELRTRGYAASRFDDTGFVVDPGDGRRLLLDRLYTAVQELSDSVRADRIAAGVDAALRPPPQTWAEAQPMLRSVPRPSSFTAAVTGADDRPWIRPLWPFVHELAVIDIGAARAVVTEADTARWGVSGEQMFAVARGNIAARYPPQPQQERIGHLRGDGHSYCDSAVLVPGWLSSFADGSGAPLVFFPGDEVLLVCTDDPDVAPAFFAAAERIYRQAAVPISPQGYTIVGPSIVGLDSTGRSPLRAQAVRARSVLAEHEYAAQTRRLRQHFAEQAVDMSVAEVQVIETPRGSCTMTVWTQGTPPVPCLLPVADYVTLLPADRTDHVTTPFPVFADVMGLTRDQNLLPRRYPVADWPSPAELSVLREHAVALPGI